MEKLTMDGLRTYLIENNRMLVVYGQESRYYSQQWLEEMNSLSSQVESVLSLDKASICSYFSLPFMLIGNKHKKKKMNLLPHIILFYMISELVITQAPSQVWGNCRQCYFERLILFYIIIIKASKWYPKFSFCTLSYKKSMRNLLDETRE